MGILTTGFIPDIINAYGGLRASMRAQIHRNYGEERLLALVAYGCFAIFLSFLPRLLATNLSASPEQSIAAGIIMWFFVVMFFFPLLFYAVAAISHLIARVFGANGSFFNARHALFWMLTVLSPVLLVKAMLTSVFIQIGGTAGENLLMALNIILVSAILRIWGAFLAEVEGFSRTYITSLLIAITFITLGVVVYLIS
ncbi:MAG: hypothetical protein V3V13_12375 [Paracoccaceae bacterium]